jgi:EAL domain-containing protein (putative c-di-GMP-specific phosphodiesterase class I)
MTVYLQGRGKDTATDAVNRAMMAAINQVGHVTGAKTIAEFVENDSILEHVQKIGVDYARGYAGARCSL